MKRPQVGWGILTPDPELNADTQKVLELLGQLPRGQVDLLLTRCVGRYLHVELGLDDGQEPNRAQMVKCTAALGNAFNDLLGRP